MKIPEAAKNWIIVSLLTAISGWFIGILRRQSALKNGMRAILRDRILSKCKEHLREKQISADDLDNLNEMYDAYIGLKGNGTVPKVYKEVLKLPSFK